MKDSAAHHTKTRLRTASGPATGSLPKLNSNSPLAADSTASATPGATSSCPGGSTCRYFPGSFPGHQYGRRRLPGNCASRLDMAGNVWEWTSDWYRTDYYGTLAGSGQIAVNPEAPADSFDPSDPGVQKTSAARGLLSLYRPILFSLCRRRTRKRGARHRNESPRLSLRAQSLPETGKVFRIVRDRRREDCRSTKRLARASILLPIHSLGIAHQLGFRGAAEFIGALPGGFHPGGCRRHRIPCLPQHSLQRVEREMFRDGRYQPSQ